MKTAESYGSHFGMSSKKESDTHSATGKTKPVNKHILELQRKTRMIIEGLYLLALFSRRFISFCLVIEVESVHTLFLFSHW